MSELTPQQRAHNRFMAWAIVVLAIPVVVVFIWVNIANNTAKQKDADDAAWCSTVNHNSPEAIWCLNHNYRTP